MQLTSEELAFVTAAAVKLKTAFPPAPFFILSPKALQAQDRDIVKNDLPELLRDNGLMEEIVTATGMDRGKVSFLISEAMEFVLWERSWATRLQWVLQYIAIFVIINVLWLLI